MRLHILARTWEGCRCRDSQRLRSPKARRGNVLKCRTCQQTKGDVHSPTLSSRQSSKQRGSKYAGQLSEVWLDRVLRGPPRCDVCSLIRHKPERLRGDVPFAMPPRAWERIEGT